MVRRPRRSDRWSIRTWLAIATGTVASLALVFTFMPWLQAAGQVVFRDSDKFNSHDTAALTQLPIGKQLVARGLKPQFKAGDGQVMWSVDCKSIDADDCLASIATNGNRVIYTSYSRDWRGTIDGVQLSMASWINDVNSRPGRVLTEFSFCTVVHGATVDDLLTQRLPSTKCK